MSDVSLANTTSGISGKTAACHDVDGSTTSLWTFNRSSSAPFAVSSGAATVTNLDADKLDGQDSTYFTNATNLASGTVPTARLGSGSASASSFLRGDSTWAAAFASNDVCNGRLTLTSGTPITTGDVTGATSIYFAPYKGKYISLYDGAALWNVIAFTETTLALGTITSALPYDVFGYNNSGTLALELLAWTSDTARATALTTQDGVLVKTGATTRRYLGTFRTTSTTTTEDSAAKRFVWNYYNRLRRPMLVQEATDSWNYTTATIRQARATTSNQLDCVIGWAESPIHVDVLAHARNATGNPFITVGIGEDTTTIFTAAGSFGGFVMDSTVSQIAQCRAALDKIPAVGRHFYSWNEYSEAAGTTIWYGDAGALLLQSGLSGWVDG